MDFISILPIFVMACFAGFMSCGSALLIPRVALC